MVHSPSIDGIDVYLNICMDHSVHLASDPPGSAYALLPAAPKFVARFCWNWTIYGSKVFSTHTIIQTLLFQVYSRLVSMILLAENKDIPPSRLSNVNI